MTRAKRLAHIMSLLRDGTVRTAADLSRETGASLRSIYRDMAHLQRTGAPVTGTRGTGYRVGADHCLAPLNLSADELEALHLGLAVVGEGGDATLSTAALSLSRKLEAALPETAETAHLRFGHALPPYDAVHQGVGHIAPVRAAIRARQKLAVETAHGRIVLRPLALDYWARRWTVTGWSETDAGFCDLPLDEVTALRALPGLFADEPGKSLADARDRP